MSAAFPAQAERPIRRFALFEYGFRPFFLLAGLFALFGVLAWLLAFAHGLWPSEGPGALSWHAHEMLFAFVTAAIAGFLLTAVPNWTGRGGFSRSLLIALTLLWLAGRWAMSPLFPFDPLAAAALDLAFLPALAAIIGRHLLRGRNYRNLPILAVLIVFAAANLLVHLERAGITMDTAHAGQMLAMNLTLLLVVLIGGRIVPSFTLSTLRRLGRPVEIAQPRALEIACLLSVLGVLAADLALPGSTAAGIAAALAALFNGVRLGLWKGYRTLRDPLLWVLHVGYLWIPVGLTLKALWLLGGMEIGMNWLHALTFGGFSTMILAVMTRATLGHTGRALRAAPATAISYVLLTAGATIRVFGPALFPAQTLPSVAAAGLLWMTAFALFLFVYGPILTGPRADGRPG
ncbi:NnrS family protein [Oceanibaculum sp.]|uniref:NnrS family protein n=1 Tax=Oceanibaculum sp. TaxID=1903597 RepID=UPI00258E4A11|nr:NnrS family protein [Oceanibaculum sp.]MCH2394691.1 NnrS family protein [Oceanibaculum sp.]